MLLDAMFNFGKQESRKFIDLLLKSTNNKWTNIDANTRIRVGDFGYVERSTGDFIVKGNLYDDDATSEAMKQYPIVTSAPMRLEKYTSKGVKDLGPNPGASEEVQPLFESGFSGKWEFKRERGALLLMAEAKITTMERFPKELLKVKHNDAREIIKRYTICTSVVSCPAFVLYLGNTQDHIFEVSFVNTTPVPDAFGVPAGAGVEANWAFGQAHGILKQGLDNRQQYVFYPLYSLKRISWGHVGTVIRGEEDGEIAEKDFWEDAQVPWATLDDDGAEKGLEEDSGEPLD